MVESRGSQSMPAMSKGGGGTHAPDTQAGMRAATTSESGENGMAEMAKQGQEAVSQAQEQAVKLVGMAREQATTQVTSQKERAAGLLGAVGTALHDASGQVREQDEAAMADAMDAAAKQVDQLAAMLKEQDLGQLIETTQQFARRQPVLFLAAAFAVGFVGLRFFKSSSETGGALPTGASALGSSGSTSGDGMGRDYAAAPFADSASTHAMASGGLKTGRQ